MVYIIDDFLVDLDQKYIDKCYRLDYARNSKAGVLFINIVILGVWILQNQILHHREANLLHFMLGFIPFIKAILGSLDIIIHSLCPWDNRMTTDYVYTMRVIFSVLF